MTYSNKIFTMRCYYSNVHIERDQVLVTWSIFSQHWRHTIEKRSTHVIEIRQLIVDLRDNTTRRSFIHNSYHRVRVTTPKSNHLYPLVCACIHVIAIIIQHMWTSTFRISTNTHVAITLVHIHIYLQSNMQSSNPSAARWKCRVNNHPSFIALEKTRLEIIITHALVLVRVGVSEHSRVSVKYNEGMRICTHGSHSQRIYLSMRFTHFCTHTHAHIS